MFKYLLFFLISISLIYPLNGKNSYWSKVDSLGIYKASIRGIRCYDSLNCISLFVLGGAGGHMFKLTSDGGYSWQIVYLDSAYIGHDSVKTHWVPDIYDIAYPNGKLFIATGDSGLVIRTTDKGETWDIQRTDTIMRNGRVCFYDDKIGLMSSLQMDIVSDRKAYFNFTKDGGKNWQIKQWPRDSAGEIIGINELKYLYPDLFVTNTSFRVNDSLVHAYLLFVNGEWDSWDTVLKPGSNSQYMLNKDIGWVAGGYKLKDSAGWESWNQVIHHTIDGGRTWIKQLDTIMNGYPLNDIEFYDENFGMASSFGALIYITEDGGKTWIPDLIIDTPQDGSAKMVQYIQVPSSNTAFIVYNKKYVYKWTRPLTSVIDTDTKFVLSPNPASDYIEISGADGEVKIYDLLGVMVQNGMDALRRSDDSRLHGNDIQVRGNDTPPTPSQEGVRIDVSHLSPGIYFVRIGNIVQKFVKL